MSEILKVMEKHAEEGPEGTYISLFLELEQPSQLEYQFGNCLWQSELSYRKKGLIEKKKNLFSGIEATFTFDTFGVVRRPNDFEDMECRVDLNSTGGLDYLEYAERGSVGSGFYNALISRFEIYLRVAPQIARDIIYRKLLAKELLPETSDSDAGPNWMKFRIDAVNYRDRRISGQSVPNVEFDIARVYCYSSYSIDFISGYPGH